MEEQIAEYLNGIVEDRGLSTYYFKKRGLPPVTLDRILQKADNKGKSYTTKSLSTLLNILDIKSIKIGKCTIKV